MSWAFRKGNKIVEWRRDILGVLRTEFRIEALQDWLDEEVTNLACDLARHPALKNTPWWDIREKLYEELAEEAQDRVCQEGGRIIGDVVLIPEGVELSQPGEGKADPELPEEWRRFVEGGVEGPLPEREVEDVLAAEQAHGALLRGRG